MKKLLICFLSFLVFTNAFAADPTEHGEVFVNDRNLSDFAIGADISSYNIDLSTANTILISPSCFVPYFNIYENSYWYRIAIADNKVDTLFVSEAYFGKRFKTEEGVFLGMTKNELLKICPYLSFTKINGWGTEAQLKSGWKILLSNKDGTDIVSSIYKNGKTDMVIKIKILRDSIDFIMTAVIEDNSSAAAFYELLQKGDVTVKMHDYGNFEKVGTLPKSLPRNDKQITTAPGDIILYQGNQITIYYDVNSWNFTKLGKVEGNTQEELKQILGKGDVTAVFSVME